MDKTPNHPSEVTQCRVTKTQATYGNQLETRDETAYGKVVFAENVVRANAPTVDFSDFSDLLSRIDQCLTHYKTVVHMALSAATTGTTGTP